MRIALALLVIAACGKSSAPDNRTESSTQPVSSQPAPPSPEPATGPKVATVDTSVLARQAKAALGEADAGVAPSDPPASVDTSSGKAASGTVRVISQTSFDKTSLSAHALADEITKQHLGALGNCYRATLARDASVKGKATLALTVKIDGTLASAKATAPDATLQSCFTQAMQTWKFPVPTNADGEPTEAGFQIGLALASP